MAWVRGTGGYEVQLFCVELREEKGGGGGGGGGGMGAWENLGDIGIGRRFTDQNYKKAR